LARAMVGQNYFYPVHLTLFTVTFNANEEYERRFYSILYSYPGSRYWQQFEEMASARQSSSFASGTSNNTNGSRAKLLVQLWAGIHELLYSVESRTYSMDKNLRRVKLSHEPFLQFPAPYLLRIFQSVTFWFQHVGLKRPLPKFGTCEIFAKTWKYFEQTKLAQIYSTGRKPDNVCLTNLSNSLSLCPHVKANKLRNFNQQMTDYKACIRLSGV